MNIYTAGQRFRQQRLLLGTALGGLFIGAVVSTGCQSVPVSERRQLLLVSEAEENKMGLAAYQKVLQSEPVTKNESVADIVQRIGQRIAAVADRPDFDWEFKVIESETQNAFCLPGGKVAVYTGILPICRNEAGLAVVMSHEIGHAIARHGGERMTHQMVQNKVKDGVAFLMRDKEDRTQKIVLTAYGAGAQYGAILPYSRKHELEADQIGIMLMARAGYDPSEAPEFWERFSGQKSGSAPLEFLSTHPSDAHRSSALREVLPQAMKLYDAASDRMGSGEVLEDVIKPAAKPGV